MLSRRVSGQVEGMEGAVLFCSSVGPQFSLAFSPPDPDQHASWRSNANDNWKFDKTDSQLN